MHEFEGMTATLRGGSVGQQISGKFSDPDVPKWMFSSSYSSNKRKEKPIKHH